MRAYGRVGGAIMPMDGMKDKLRRQIELGELSEGTQIPSEVELMRALGVSRAQAREALAELEHEGYILRYQGRGSFVAPVNHRKKRLGIKGFRLMAMSCNRLASHYKRTVMDAFARELHEHGVQSLTYFLDPASDAEQQFLCGIRTSGVEGIALWIRDRSETTQAVLRTFQESRFPFVLCDRACAGIEADCVSSNNERIGYELTRHLISQGHTRIAFMGSLVRMTSTEDRETGYRRALCEAGLPVDEQHVRWPQDAGETLESTINAIMAQKKRPTAMTCCDDGIVATAAEVLSSLGYSLPRDMAFAAVDDDRALQGLGYPVFSLCQDGEAIGRQTAGLLLARAADPRRAVQRILVEPLCAENAAERRMDKVDNPV